MAQTTTTAASNPLLDQAEFTPYSKVRAEHIVPAAKEVIVQATAMLEETVKLLDADASCLTFDNILKAFIEMEDVIERVWSPVENLLSLKGEKAIRDAAEEARPLIVEFYNEYSLDERVYKLIKKYSETEEAKSLTGEKQRYLEETVKDFKLSGAELNNKDKAEFKKLSLELSQLSQKFSDNVTDSKFNLILVNKADLAGLPEDIIAMAQAKADEFRTMLAGSEASDEEKQQFKAVTEIYSNGLFQDFTDIVPEGSWAFNLDYPSYGPLTKFVDNADLRKRMYFEYLNKASAGDKNNYPLIDQIFLAKQRKAELLGFKNYAELSIESKMAESPEQVQDFLEKLSVKVKPLAKIEYQALLKFQRELAEKSGFKNSENDLNKVYPWDSAYLSEKLRKQEYDFDTNLLKPYFELNACLDGMFKLAENLFEVRFQKSSEQDVWHEDVTLYDVLNLKGERVGNFYIDLYPRDVKRQGAWMMPLVQRHEEDHYCRLPQAVLSCNLSKPTAGQKSLLTHMEVLTLFHEFGHSLHHFLTQVKLSPLSGTNVDWDFVELPSQLFENWTWEKEALATFAKHHESKAEIPEELLDKMIKARNFNEGLACTRQIEFALFDLYYHMQTRLNERATPLELFKQVSKDVGVFDVPEGTHFPAAFSHIYAGGYAAGYYSYKWAEVLEADAFSRFKKEGILNPSVGQAYKQSILEKGNSQPPMELFKEFMGREPNENALLERMGVA